MVDAPEDEPGDGQAPVLWMRLPSIAAMRRRERLERSRPERFDLTNRRHIAANAPERGRNDARWFAGMPVPRLPIRQAGFAPDLIRAGLHFASARFRSAAALFQDAMGRLVATEDLAARVVGAGLRDVAQDMAGPASLGRRAFGSGSPPAAGTAPAPARARAEP